MPDFKLDDFLYKSNIIQPLKGFCNTIQEGSINKAAQKMGLTQSTVTRQIKALERDLGIALFDRVGNRVVPTKEGEKLYEMAIVQLQGLESLMHNFHKEIKERNDNTLTIAVHQAVGAYILPKYIRQLLDQDEFKDLNIVISNIPKKEAFKRLVNKEIDLAFYSSTYEEEVPVEIEEDKIFKYKSTLILHKNHPLAKKDYITKEDMQKYKYLIRDGASLYNIKKSLNLDAGNIRFENGTVEMTIGLIAENIDMTGIANTIIDNNSIHLNPDIVCKDTTHLFLDSTYSIFYLKNEIYKKNLEYLINQIKKDKEV
jgi:DNA-binding transcriptional LysR family regulator